MIESSDNEIESGVKSLCDAVNSYDGLETHFSCQGHPDENRYRGYVLFTSQNDKSLLSLLKKFPQVGKITFNRNKEIYKVWCRVEAEAIQNELAYSIRFGGMPAQCLRLVRDQLAEILNGKRRSLNVNSIDQY